MPPQWISAKTAHAIFADVSGDALAAMALCRGAHLGLFKTRARLLSIDGKVSHDVDLPKNFWWAEGHEALSLNWNLGDFETWIDRKVRLQAQNVEFDFSDLRQSLEPEKAAIMARQLSVAGNAEWMTAKAARMFMYNEMGAQPVKAGALLIEQCALGFVAARAVVWQQSAPAQFADWAIGERERDIPQWFWSEFCKPEKSSQDWESGCFSGQGRSPKGPCKISLSAVHFSQASIRALKGEGLEAKTSVIQPRPAGRPPAAFWDDLWVEIWGRIYDGDFLPKRQSEIEKAMLQWVEDKGQSLSPTVAREKARKMWARINAKGGNA